MARQRPFISDTVREALACALAAVLVTAALLHTARTAVRAAEVTEGDVKAAFVYNLAKFVQWPPEVLADDGALRLCILGRDPFGPAMSRVIDAAGPHDRKLVARRIGGIPTGHSCHILFISSSESERLGAILDQVRGNGVLTVGDTVGYAHRGVVINLIVVDEKVRFDVNIEAARQAGLKVSSKLLKLASIVRGKRSGEIQ